MDPSILALATKAIREANGIICPRPSKLPVWQSKETPWLPLVYALSTSPVLLDPDSSPQGSLIGQLALASSSRILRRSLTLGQGGPDVIMHAHDRVLIGRAVPSRLGFPVFEPFEDHPSHHTFQSLDRLSLSRTPSGALCSVVASKQSSFGGLEITWCRSSDEVPSTVRYILEMPSTGLSFYEVDRPFLAEDVPWYQTAAPFRFADDECLSLHGLDGTDRRIVGCLTSIYWMGSVQYPAMFVCLAPERSDVAYWHIEYIPRHIKCVDEDYIIMTSQHRETLLGNGRRDSVGHAYSVVFRSPPLTASDRPYADRQSWTSNQQVPVFERSWLKAVPNAVKCYLADPVVVHTEGGRTVRFDMVVSRNVPASSTGEERTSWWIYQATYAITPESMSEQPLTDPHLAEITSWPALSLIMPTHPPRFYVFEDDIVVHHLCVCRENDNIDCSYLLHRLPASSSVPNQECSSRVVPLKNGNGVHRWDPLSGVGVSFRYDEEWLNSADKGRMYGDPLKPVHGENYAVLFSPQ